MKKIIKAENLSRDFKIAKPEKKFFRYLFFRKHEIKRAVNNINFEVGQGESVGYIGPNGAGKSTTIKMLTGILKPTSGSVLVRGNAPHLKRKENAKHIGVVFGQRSQLWWDLPVRDSFELLRHIYKIPKNVYEDNLKRCKAMLEIDKFAHIPVRQISLGQKMRANFVAALLHNPEILFLDEPTIGLDVVVKKQIRDFIRLIKRERGLTVILTTHDMKDIEEICERIILINRGEILLDMGINDVKNKLNNANKLIVVFEKEPNPDKINFAKIISKEGTRWTLKFPSESISANEIVTKMTRISKIRDIYMKEPDFEDIVHDLYTKKNTKSHIIAEKSHSFSEGKEV